ncbi:unnamed protein product, partial [Iphiclides podalirius]
MVASHCHKVLLKAVPLTLHGPNGSLHTHAILDDGATVTLISADIADELGLQGENVIMRARSAWDSGELVCIVERVYPGSDGRVRVVDVRTRSGVIKRSAAHVALLRVIDSCQQTDTGGEDVDDGHAASPGI